MIVWTQSGLGDMLGDWTAGSLISESGTLRLYSNDYTPGPTSGLSDFTESAFDGYAPLPLTDWGTGIVFDIDGNATIGSSGAYSFTKSLGPHPEFAYGWYVTTGAGAVVLAERFPAKAGFDAPGDDVNIKMVLRLGACP
jgi:hypothetical protein